MKLIDEWHKAHQLLSVRVAAAIFVFGMLPQDGQAAILDL